MDVNAYWNIAYRRTSVARCSSTDKSIVITNKCDVLKPDIPSVKDS